MNQVGDHLFVRKMTVLRHYGTKPAVFLYSQMAQDTLD